ncbi:MAG: GDSL-type esterase/lipase family protein [Fuerstiella sp.]|nr:GDSL-type esterase/lipase family protein [Fuerstiella sp.]
MIEDHRIAFAAYQPESVVLYGGVNDMRTRGRKTPSDVLSDYRKLVKAVHAVLRNIRIVYISLPHFYRDRGNPDANARSTPVNDMIAEATEKNKRLVFVNLNEPMADRNGQPRRQLFQTDGIHMNTAGYKLWASQLRPHLRFQETSHESGGTTVNVRWPCDRTGVCSSSS